MPEEPPAYIQEAILGADVLRFHWDEWDDTIGVPDEVMLSQLQNLALRSNFALTVAAAEWIVFRFDDFCDDTLPYEAIDAGWAQVIDPRYAVAWNPFDRDEWSGPTLGPIRRAILLMQDYANLLLQRADTALGAAKMLSLAAHVVPNAKPFSDWQTSVTRRLVELFPYRESDPLGDPVPREVFDPGYAFDPAQTESLLKNYLNKLDFNDNEFLEPPDQMIQAGFQGKPYTFDLQSDRLSRRSAVQ